MKNDLRWIIAMWLLECALAVAPNDRSKKSLLLAICPWITREREAAEVRLVSGGFRK